MTQGGQREKEDKENNKLWTHSFSYEIKSEKD